MLERAPAQPAGLVERIQALARRPTAESVAAFAEHVRGFRTWETRGVIWPVRSMRDTELDWVHGGTAIERI